MNDGDRGNIEQGRPVLLRNGLVLTMDDARRVLPGTDVLIVGERIAAIGPTRGEDAWHKGMNPDIPATTVLDNPYTYTEWDAGSAQWKHSDRR